MIFGFNTLLSSSLLIASSFPAAVWLYGSASNDCSFLSVDSNFQQSLLLFFLSCWQYLQCVLAFCVFHNHCSDLKLYKFAASQIRRQDNPKVWPWGKTCRCWCNKGIFKFLLVLLDLSVQIFLVLSYISTSLLTMSICSCRLSTLSIELLSICTSLFSIPSLITPIFLPCCFWCSLQTLCFLPFNIS